MKKETSILEIERLKVTAVCPRDNGTQTREQVQDITYSTGEKGKIKKYCSHP